jgi:hypothetical protein
LLALNGMTVSNPGDTLKEFSQLRQQVPPNGRVEDLHMIHNQPFLSTFKVCFLQGQDKLASTQNLVKLQTSLLTGGEVAQLGQIVPLDRRDLVMNSVAFHARPPESMLDLHHATLSS